MPTAVPSFIIKFAPHISSNLIDKLADFLALRFQAQCSTAPLNFDLHFAYHAQRGQFSSAQILAQVKFLTEPSFRAVLIVVDSDLYIPGVSFVFGEAEVGGQVAIISLARLKPAPLNPASGKKLSAPADLPTASLSTIKEINADQFFMRICKEATHELGHVLGLRHCEQDQCVMHFAHNITEVDYRSDRFCIDCSQNLAESIYYPNF